jgi:hypothetical protein
MKETMPEVQSENPKPKPKIGRPRGSKNRPKWILDELKKLPKRPVGRPKGATNRPATLEELIDQAGTYKTPTRPIRHRAKRRDTVEPYYARLKREDPERLRAICASTNAARPKGAPPHMTKRQWAIVLDEAHKLARKIMNKLDEEGALPENKIAREAMQQAITMLASDISSKDKLSVIRTLLEYNMAKPAATSNLNIKTAEDFLDDLADKG